MISSYEQELILSHILKKSREYILTHPEIKLNKNQSSLFRKMTHRRQKNEPMAYIFGQKGFYGLDFKVNKHTLIPRPETEVLVDEIIKLKPKNRVIVDIGTGSGNIITSLAKNIGEKNKYYGIDISSKALRIAKLNAKKNKVDKKIKFLKGNLLNPIIRNYLLKAYRLQTEKLKFKNYIIAANLPYLSKNNYRSAMPDVKKFEPKSALLSGSDGLNHYTKFFKQLGCFVKTFCVLQTVCCIEISPEQKNKIKGLVKLNFPNSEIKFKKDLANKWRLAIIFIK